MNYKILKIAILLKIIVEERGREAMVRSRFKADFARLKNSESYILELLLLVYPLQFIAGGIAISPHFLVIILAIVTGIVAYFLYSSSSYSVKSGLLISLLTVTPLFFIGIPLPVVSFMLLYVYWRMSANFSTERSTRWAFILINTITFTCFYLFVRIYSINAAFAAEANQTQVILFLLTTLLYIGLRFSGIWLSGKSNEMFSTKEVGKFFASIIGVGVVAFLSVYFFIAYVRATIIAIFGFLFGGLFMFFGKLTLPAFNKMIELLKVEKDEQDANELNLSGEESIIEENVQNNIDIFLSVSAVILALILLFFIVRKRKKLLLIKRDHAYTFESKGRRKKHKELPTYDYSMATNVVRNAYKIFERDAHVAKSPRTSGETVKEWFARMGWGQNETLFSTYDKARYSTHRITEEEAQDFVDELQKIKIKFFKLGV
jgi:hypothetical protein